MVDRMLSRQSQKLEHNRTLKSQSRVASKPIIEHFDEFKDIRSGLGSGRITTMMDQFRFQCAKEAFHGCIVITIAGSAHATPELVFGQQGLIFLAGVLAAPV